MSLGRRVGTFLNLLGAGLLVLFVISDVSAAPDLSLLLWGGLCLAGGILFWMKNPLPAAPPSGRFGLLKRPLFKKKQKKDEK